eukprot:TRINITY_DN21304_c0_g1_i1.p1 TRINITY_DN21304_c0_g1~~TRINITY_DN21304_c0_g1_i1.p1  ORF type:complete len:402 (+),score=-4.41 TRINITY_DN21304_c0_g1_i1:186-1391(+)
MVVSSLKVHAVCAARLCAPALEHSTSPRHGRLSTALRPVSFRHSIASTACLSSPLRIARAARRFPVGPVASVESTTGPAVSAEDDAEECNVVHGKDLVLGLGTSGGDPANVTSAAIAAAKRGLVGKGFRAHLVEPVRNVNGSGVVLLTDELGLDNEDTRMFAYRLACFGYSVLIPDVFRGNPFDATYSDLPTWLASIDTAQLAADVDTAGQFLASAISYPSAKAPGNGRIALLGFGLGAGRVLEVLAADGSSATAGAGSGDAAVAAGEQLRARLYSAGVFFYGTNFDVDAAASVQVPLLLIAGKDDEQCTPATVGEVADRAGGGSHSLKGAFEWALGKGKERGDSQVVLRLYDGCGHGFAHRPRNMDEDDDAEDAFQATRHWLHQHLLEGVDGWTAPVASP